MNISVTECSAEPLLFSWESPRRGNLAVVGFFALSLVMHALCFYVFQIVYPPTVALLPPPARVTLFTAASEEGRTLLRWIDSEDPALAFTTQNSPEGRLRALPKVDHIPSYHTVEAVLKEAPLLKVDLSIPSSQPAGPVPMFYREPARAIGPIKTSVSFSEELQLFGAPSLPTPDFAASNGEIPEAIRFRIAVSGTGEIRYCFPLNSSGEPALDEQARRYLALCRFPQATAGAVRVDPFLTWGIATILWGSDVGRSRPTATDTATP
jgi:hypothetical protein